jgi:hypothetical protein
LTDSDVIEVSSEKKLRDELNALPIEELNQRIIELAVLYGADEGALYNDPTEALDYLDDNRDFVSRGERAGSERGKHLWNEPTQNNPEDWALYRASIRIHALSTQILGETAGVFMGEFHGSGDSGNYEVATGDALVDNFLEKMLDRHVTFDWYNNDGGQGDITWNVAEDTIVINGSYNVMESVTEMDEEEF